MFTTKTCLLQQSNFEDWNIWKYALEFYFKYWQKHEFSGNLISRIEIFQNFCRDSMPGMKFFYNFTRHNWKWWLCRLKWILDFVSCQLPCFVYKKRLHCILDRFYEISKITTETVVRKRSEKQIPSNSVKILEKYLYGEIHVSDFEKVSLRQFWMKRNHFRVNMRKKNMKTRNFVMH